MALPDSLPNPIQPSGLVPPKPSASRVDASPVDASPVGASLLSRLDSLGRKAWWLTLGLRVFQSILLIAVCVVAIITLDHGLRSIQPAWRWGVSLSTLIAILGSLWYFFRHFEWRYPSAQRVASWVERSLLVTASAASQNRSAATMSGQATLSPRWLSSTVSLLLDSRVRQHVSPDLLAQAIEEGERESESVDLEKSLRSSKVLQWGFLALLPIIFLAFQAMFAPAHVSIAFQRLAMPWRDVRWPSTVELAWVDLPSQAAAGEPIWITIENRRGVMPKDLTLHVREANNATEVHQPIASIASTSKASTSVPEVESRSSSPESTSPRAKTRLLSSASYVDVRATGGDDLEMPWHRIELLQPCHLIEGELEVEPPAYLNRSSYRTTGPFLIPVGSRVRLMGKWSRPMRDLKLAQSLSESSSSESSSTRFTLEGKDSGGDAMMESVALAENQCDFVWPASHQPGFLIESSQQWQLHWTSQDGLVGQSEPRWDLRMVPDLAPQVAILNPSQDTSLTADGSVAMEGAAMDDFGIAKIQLHWERLDRDRLVEAQGTIDIPVQPSPSNPGQQDSAGPPRNWRSSWNWTPADAMVLAPGTTLQCWLVATDYRGRSAESKRRSLRILDPTLLLEEMGREQLQLVQKLERSLEWQRRAMQALESLRRALHAEASPSTLGTYLTELATHQGRVRLELLADVDSVRELLLRQLHQLQTNHLGDHSIARLLQQIAQWLDRSERTTFLTMDRQGAEWAESFQQSRWETIRASFEGQSELVRKSQEAVEQGLVEWIDQLKSVGKSQALQNELQSLIATQHELADASRRLAEVALQSGLSDEQREASQAIRNRQNELARQLEGVQRSLRSEEARLASQDGNKEPGRLDAVRELRKRLENQDMVADMRRAAALLQEQRLAQGSELQEEIAKRMESALTDSRNDSQGLDAEDASQSWARLLETLLPQQSGIADRWKTLVQESPHEVTQESETLSRAQEQAERLLDEFLAKPRQASALDWVGQTALDAMRRSSQSAARQQWALAARSASLAADRLHSMKKALDYSTTKPSTDGSNQESTGATQESSSPASGLRMQELILLRDIQDTIRERTKQISQAANQAKLNAEQWMEVNELANQQKELLETLRSLLSAPPK